MNIESISPHSASLMRDLLTLWKKISLRRRAQTTMFVALILFSSVAEMMSIGIVLPFLGVLTSPEKLFENSYVRSFAQWLGIQTVQELLWPITLIFCSSVIFACLMRFLTLLVNVRLSYGIGFELSLKAYRTALYQSYSFHADKNSAVIVSSITKASVIIQGVILPVLYIVSSIFLLISIVVTLCVINPLVAFGTFGGFGLIYFLIMKATNKQLAIASEAISIQSTNASKVLHEGLGGIRDILIDGTQKTYCEIFASKELPLRYASGTSMLISIGPHYAIEAIGMTLIGAAAYLLAVYSTGGVMAAVPTLGALVLGAQRVLPVLQKLYGSWSEIKANRGNLRDVLNLLNRPMTEFTEEDKAKNLKFNYQIELTNISFSYPNKPEKLINNLNLNITKGERIGIIGKTGAGKSTLLDIIMGLLQPSSGSLLIDSEIITTFNQRSWRSHIAHVPQSIFIADLSIAENIAFGTPFDQINFEHIRLAASYAQIADVIESWADGYLTMVGERGVRLSGGQRQRIGLARAFYKNADVIILDEATSALDNQTELEVMNNIEAFDKTLTVIIVAHRLTTLRFCSRIIEISNGCIVRSGTYKEMVEE